MKQTFVFLFLSLLHTPHILQAQNTDSVSSHVMQHVEVSERIPKRTVRSSVPLQKMTQKELEHLPALQISDVVKFFSGVQVKDYGGVGGLKTVSVRGLGTQHTAVAYDGLMLTDAQSGQIDLGKFSIDQVQSVTLIQGQSDDLLQTARALASGSVLSLETSAPDFQRKQQYSIVSAIKSGSWGLLQPMCQLNYTGRRLWSGGVSAEWMQTDGHYPYTLRYGTEDALTERKKRTNTDVRSLRVEANTVKAWNNGGLLTARGYFYRSKRGLPGATIYYYDHAAQRLDDDLAFLQLRYRKDFSNQWSLTSAAKWNMSEQDYRDPDYKGAEGSQHSHYSQQEYYATASVRYRPFTPLAFSLAMDGSLQTMDANMKNFARPQRYTWLTAVNGKYTLGWATVNASALVTYIGEQVQQGQAATNRLKVSPFVSLALHPFSNEAFRLRFFFKDIFRMPSFNDLYYGAIGTRTLKPERALQYNVGMTYEKRITSWFPNLSVTADAYFNRVTDKIVAIPTKNLFVWSMVNLGKVSIRGIDVTAQMHFKPIQRMQLQLSGNYTYQRALDITGNDPNSVAHKTYRHQIPYTPRVYASGSVACITPWGTLSYAFLYSGKRYALGENIAVNRLNPYQDHSIAYRYRFPWQKHMVDIQAEVLNVCDKNYEVVRNFPMPGRSFRVTLTYRFNQNT